MPPATRTAAAAALSMLPASIARALEIPTFRHSGTIKDVQHIVVLTQENRSFEWPLTKRDHSMGYYTEAEFGFSCGPAPTARPRLRITVEPAGWRFDTDGATRTGGRRLPGRHPPAELVPQRHLPGVRPEERAAGWILPRIAHPETDLILEVPSAMRTGETG